MQGKIGARGLAGRWIAPQTAGLPRDFSIALLVFALGLLALGCRDARQEGGKSLPNVASALPTAAASAPAPPVQRRLSSPYLLHHVEGAPSPLWIVGSVHVLTAADAALPTSVEAAAGAADELAVELEIDQLDEAAVRAQTVTAGALPANRTLDDLLSPELQRALPPLVLEQAKVPWSVASRLRPWLVAQMLVQSELSRLGYEARFGLDRRLLARARGRGLPVTALETLEEQLSVFRELTTEEETALLEEAVRDRASTGAELSELTESWRLGDLDGVERLTRRSLSGPRHARFAKRLLDDRNVRMVDRLLVLAASKPAKAGSTKTPSHGAPTPQRRLLVVVGAAHLVGANGLLALLSQRGLRVTAGF